MKARLKNPAMIIPDAVQPLITLGKIITSGPVPAKTLELVHLRASQINGCAVCVELGISKTTETPQRLAAVAVWRESPLFSEPERAALDLAEAITRMADRPNPVPDSVWNEAAKHYDERALASLVLHISVTNLYNRVNVATRQIAGAHNW
jgi:alkylhydroperoxidase family enzyme